MKTIDEFAKENPDGALNTLCQVNSIVVYGRPSIQGGHTCIGKGNYDGALFPDETQIEMDLDAGVNNVLRTLTGYEGEQARCAVMECYQEYGYRLHEIFGVTHMMVTKDYENKLARLGNEDFEGIEEYGKKRLQCIAARDQAYAELDEIFDGIHAMLEVRGDE